MFIAHLAHRAGPADMHSDRQVAFRRRGPDAVEFAVMQHGVVDRAIDHQADSAGVFHPEHLFLRRLGAAQRQRRGPFQPVRRFRTALLDPFVVADLQRRLEIVIVGHRREQQSRIDHLHVDPGAVHIREPGGHIHQRLVADRKLFHPGVNRRQRAADLDRAGPPGPLHGLAVDQPEGIVDPYIGRVLRRDGDRHRPPVTVFFRQIVPSLLDFVDVRIRIDIRHVRSLPIRFSGLLPITLRMRREVVNPDRSQPDGYRSAICPLLRSGP